MKFIFDNTFEGLLTAIFEVYEHRDAHAQLIADHHYQPGLLDDAVQVVSSEEKSRRVWEGLKKKIGRDWQSRFYNTFLSELPESPQHLLNFARYVFDNPKGAENNYGHPDVIALSKIDKSVNRERHRMKAFIRFQETADGIFYAAVEPDFNVLPLIAGFFKNRYADQRWIIYDLRRKYGLSYDLESVSEISLDLSPDIAEGQPLPAAQRDQKEELYSLLWKDYFRSTNIPARKNMKLHVQHVPKRYWKYLIEKQ